MVSYLHVERTCLFVLDDPIQIIHSDITTEPRAESPDRSIGGR